MSPFPLTSKNEEHLIVGIDYFTKWIEVVPSCNITQIEGGSSSGITSIPDLVFHTFWLLTMVKNLLKMRSEPNIQVTG